MRGQARSADSKSMGSEQPNRPRPKRRRSRGHTPDSTPVARLDIYASSEGATAKPAQAPGVPAPQVSAESDRRRAELDERERSESSVVQRMRALDEREGTLAEREAEVAQAHHTEVAMADVERRRRRL